MPNRKEHEYFTKLLIGKRCTKTHKRMDFLAKYYGPKHRKFFHDPISACLIGLISDGYDGIIAAFSHLCLDCIYSRYKELKKQLKGLLKKFSNIFR